ncbi:M48 family metalloprotease [Telmatospirillum siberiense]|uniref:Peptidase M48 domain-containing protein n=1 Tax=Telmatospirillum siberiense TaxID=382514 RepID=A0A2N3PPA3_9PROT|nr:M48 family metalloprotease [Telmatospirillum siberiense]PKU22249.1 hypothetical protein CWS72_22540 [Telmatospirillum siberiense]
MGASGIFTNRKTNARVEADLRIVGNSLEIRDPRDKILLAQWAYADMTPARPLRPGRPIRKLRIICHNDSEAHLLIEDPDLITLLQKANHALRPPRKPLPPWLFKVAAGAGGVLLLALLLQLAAAAAGPLSRMLPVSWEAAANQRLADHLLRSFGGACTGPGGQAALDVLGQRFDRDAARGLPVHLKAVKTPAIDVYAVPKATILVTAGMVGDVETPDQLAAVIALQLAHLDLRHTAEQITRRTDVGLLFLAASDIAPTFAKGSLGHLVRLDYDPPEEIEAIDLAQKLLQKADISIQALGSYFRLQELHQRARKQPSDFQTHHPIPAKRQDPQGIQPFTRPALTDREWQSLRNICS